MELEEIDRQISRTIEVMKATISERMKAPPSLTVSQWADRYRKLSPEASAEPGQWNTARNEPMRGVMDAVSDHSVHTVVVVSSAQVGKTETLSNIIGFHVAQDPAPMLLLQPTLEMGEAYSKDRLAPMVRDTPALKGTIKDPRSRDSGNTLLHKVFPGGHITIAGANSPASLASRPIRIVLADEVDRYPPSAGTEGDPVSLARKRSTTFWNRKTILTSTPTVKGISRIEAEWEISDKRRFHVTCTDCDHAQHLKWAQVKWPEGRPQEAAYVCEECGSIWEDAKRWTMLRKGKVDSDGTVQRNGRLPPQ
jgi:phage terminase large subunit GpA-like protein